MHEMKSFTGLLPQFLMQPLSMKISPKECDSGFEM